MGGFQSSSDALNCESQPLSSHAYHNLEKSSTILFRMVRFQNIKCTLILVFFSSFRDVYKRARCCIYICSIQEASSRKGERMSGIGCSNAAYAMPGLLRPNGGQKGSKRDNRCCSFQMPLHYPRFKKSDYETMPEWKLDCLLNEYGLPVAGDVTQKRKFAMGAFLWPSQE
jgi:hypothetical protein